MRIPKALTNQKLPDAVVYKLEKLLKQFVREYGLYVPTIRSSKMFPRRFSTEPPGEHLAFCIHSRSFAILFDLAARRALPIPKCLAGRLREVKETSISQYIIADSNGEALAASQLNRLWNYIKERTAKG